MIFSLLFSLRHVPSRNDDWRDKERLNFGRGSLQLQAIPKYLPTRKLAVVPVPLPNICPRCTSLLIPEQSLDKFSCARPSPEWLVAHLQALCVAYILSRGRTIISHTCDACGYWSHAVWVRGEHRIAGTLQGVQGVHRSYSMDKLYIFLEALRCSDYGLL